MNFVSLHIFYIFHLYIVGLLGIYTNYLLLYYLLKYGNVQNELFTWSVGVSLFLHFSHYFFGGKIGSHYFYLGLVGRSATLQLIFCLRLSLKQGSELLARNLNGKSQCFYDET